ncbi:MAG TPA: hypothetical protein OIL99_16415 [Clostridiales bacterium]|nr:hypothetical protein [Clostridiales bacterium]
MIKRKISEEMRIPAGRAEMRFRVAVRLPAFAGTIGKKNMRPNSQREDWNPLFVEALHRQPYIEYLLDLLLSDSIEERAIVVAEYGRKR